jgi:hypothetical protein
LCWAFGHRTQGNGRNNLRYVGAVTDPDTQRVVYPTAALGIIYDMKTKEQSFYQGHSEEVTCLALHPNGLLVATGDSDSNIHIWSVTTMTSQCIIKAMAPHGVQHLAFSPTGDFITSVGLDPDHTIAIYDCTTGDIISSAKGLISPNTVNDLAYSTHGTELVVVGKNQIKFYTGLIAESRALDSYYGRIGKIGKKQTFLCVTYMNEDVIVGCASGELYRFKAGQCVQVVQVRVDVRVSVRVRVRYHVIQPLSVTLTTFNPNLYPLLLLMLTTLLTLLITISLTILLTVLRTEKHFNADHDPDHD